MQFDWTYILLIVLFVLTGLLIWLGYRYLGQEKMDKILEYIRQIVLFVEQTMKDSSGADKLSTAQTLAVRKLGIDPEDARIFIEAAVKTLFNMDRK